MQARTTTLGSCFEIKADWTTPWQVFAGPSSSNPGDADAHNNLGIMLAAQEKFAEAAESYARALALEPNFADALCNLGVALGHQR